MFTFSATARWGMRLWQGRSCTSILSGLGGSFSASLVGLGSFTNGEITRATGSQPKPAMQRLFVRQTWNQGGGTEKARLRLQSNGRVGGATRRVVLTLGNFSTLDVFDENTYAKDPRTQFMNWGNWTYAAFDYAADARGFGWGFAVEWYADAWVLRTPAG